MGHKHWHEGVRIANDIPYSIIIRNKAIPIMKFKIDIFSIRIKYNDVILLTAVFGHMFLAMYIVYISRTTIDPLLSHNYESIHLFGSFINLTNVRRLLREISSVESRAYPSKHNIETTDYLMKEIQKIFQSTKANTTAHSEEQFFSPHHELFLSNGSATVNIIHRKTYMNYQMVPNIVVTLKPKNKKLDYYCLISSHYDSVEGSPGASDNALFTSVLLELIAHYSRYITNGNSVYKGLNGVTVNFQPYCNLLFLLNGAEESAMVAASAYITQHHLKNKISLLINLDSAGGDGIGWLFQTTNKASHLIKTYKKFVPYPNGNSLFEDLFKSGQIPADTDFQIYRDLGKLHGLDIAIGGNGHQYHNQYDAENVISNVTLVRETLNLGSLFTGLINDPSINDVHSHTNSFHGKYVYFDYLGKFMVVYPQYWANIINVILSFVVVPLMLADLHNLTKRSKHDCIVMISACFMAHALSSLIATMCALLVAYMMSLTNNLLSYNTYYITALLLYGIPAEIVYVCSYFYLINNSFARYIPYRPKFKQIFVYWTFIMTDLGASVIYTLLFGLSSSYVHLFSLLSLLPLLCLHQTVLCNHINPKIYCIFYHAVYASFTLAWTIYKIYLTSAFFGCALSFLDRTPCSFPSEYLVACIVSCASLAVFSNMNSLIVPMENAKNIFVKFLCFIWIVVLFFVCLTSLSPPYKPIIAPKRLTAYHMIQSQFDNNFLISNKSAKMVIMATDQNCLRGYGKRLINKLRPLNSVDRFWHSINAFTLIPEFESSMFYYDTKVPALNHIVSHPFFLNMTGLEKISSTTNRYYYELYCEQATLIDIVLPKSLTIVNWSFPQLPIANGKSSNGDNIYNQIFFISDPFNPPHFWIELKLVKSSLLSEITPFYIIVTKHHFADKNKPTPDTIALKEILPKHVAPVINIIERLDYVFEFFL